MKKIIKAKVLVLAGFLIFLSACTSEFDELNTNPNAATDVPATNVLGSSMLNSCYTLFGTRLDCYYTGAYSGFISAPDYEYRVDINNDMWKSMYITLTYAVDAANLAQTRGK